MMKRALAQAKRLCRRQSGALGQIMLIASDLGGGMALMEQQRIEIEFDRMDGAHAGRCPARGLALADSAQEIVRAAAGRNSVVAGKSVSGRVIFGGGRHI